MASHKRIDRICAAALVLTLLITVLFMNGERLGIRQASRVMGYESRLFNTSKVHTIDIVMDDWNSFIETCENEEYTSCAVVIDGEAYKNTGIRAKGNTSLSTVSSMDSSRYSFKLEFDHYDSGRSYYGLDKLSLNNVIQDSTYMKDYLTYQMMGKFGVAAPLCSYVDITVNGEDWGLYLAVEGVEDAFLQRNYGTNSGALYKPDSQSFGGGRGNGRDFSMGGLDFFQDGQPEEAFPDLPENFDPASFFKGDLPDLPEAGNGGIRGNHGGGFDGGMGGGPGGGMGSDDVKLRYIDDNPESYANIFGNAKTKVSEEDQARLIAALKALSTEDANPAEAVDVEAVLRYFVVHNFVCNGDSYTGSIVHNYYLYEKDGLLSMIPWDYNLAFGTFQGQDASSAVNAAIDSPVSGSDSRPMLDWIFASEAYTAMYHQYFADFLNSVDIAGMISETAKLIAPYVEKDPSAFYSFDEFQAGVEALETFCHLRSDSVSRQLDGSLSSVSEGRDGTGLVDTSGLVLSAMGSMNMDGGMGGPNGEHSRPDRWMNGGGAQSPDSGRNPPDSGANSPPDGARGPAGGVNAPPNRADAPIGGRDAQDGGMNRPGRESFGMGGPGNSMDAPGRAPDGGGTLSGSGMVLLGTALLVLLAGIFGVRRFRRWN